MHHFFLGKASQAVYMTGRIMNIPKILTIARIVLIPVFLLIAYWPPGVTAVCRKPSPANSLTWHLTFIGDDKLKSNVLKSNAWLQYREHTEFAQHGYATEQAQIWDDAGNLLLLSRQTVTVFA